MASVSLPTNEWLPIERAPLDGTKVDLLFHVEGLLDPRHRVTDCIFHEGRWLESCDTAYFDLTGDPVIVDGFAYSPAETTAVKATHFLIVEFPS